MNHKNDVKWFGMWRVWTKKNSLLELLVQFVDYHILVYHFVSIDRKIKTVYLFFPTMTFHSTSKKSHNFQTMNVVSFCTLSSFIPKKKRIDSQFHFGQHCETARVKHIFSCRKFISISIKITQSIFLVSIFFFEKRNLLTPFQSLARKWKEVCNEIIVG